MQLEPGRGQFLERGAIRATFDDVVRNALSSLLAGRFAGRGGLQANLFHLRGPFPIMVGLARRCAVGLPPDMRRSIEFPRPSDL